MLKYDYFVEYADEREQDGKMMMIMMAEGRNCGLVCKNEGFSDGWCRGARGRCFCTKAC